MAERKPDQAPVHAAEVAALAGISAYPSPFAARMSGRVKRRLGDRFVLRNFGVNLTTLSPGGASSLQHAHSRQDEFVFVLGGELTLVRGTETWIMSCGMCIGFPAGSASHHLENRSGKEAVYIEIGDRTDGDVVTYPLDNLVAVSEEGIWKFLHRNGEPY